MPPAIEPDDVVGREVGDARHLTEQKRTSIGQNIRQPFDLRLHEMKVAQRGRPHRLDRGHGQAVQTGAVLVQAGRHVIGVDARDIERRRSHELLLGPARQDLVGTPCLGRVEAGRGHAPLELAGDQIGVAPDVGAVLQHRCAAVAAGERSQFGLGRDRRDFHAAPGQALEAQHQPRLLGEIREVVVVEDQVAHAAFSTPSSPSRGSAFQLRDTTQSGRGSGPSCGLLATVLHET